MYPLAAALLPHPPILIPEIGGEEALEAKLTLEGIEEVARRFSSLEPDTLVLISPHGNLFQDAICILDAPKLRGDLSKFGARDLQFEYETDQEMIKNLRKDTRDFPLLFLDKKGARKLGTMELDHGATVPLYFLEKHWKVKPKLIHINYGLLSSKELAYFGGLLRRSIRLSKKKVVVLASGDLSHRLKKEGSYDYNPQGPLFDAEVGRIIKEGKLAQFLEMDKDMVEQAGECGLRSLQILAGLLEGQPISSEVLSYEGPWGVGYMSAYFKMEEEKDKLLLLAKKALESHIIDKKPLEPGEDYRELTKEKRACFVSLHKFGKLRGCIGTIEPTKDNLALEIISNAQSAASEDSRFSPVKRDEIEDLVIGVDELGPIEACSFEDLDPKNYGVIVKKGYRQGLLLPDLAGVDTPQEQVAIAREKAMIGPEEKVTYFRFKVTRHGN